MNYLLVLVFALLLIVIFLMNTRETFKTQGTLNDDRPDLSKYTETETSINNDMIQEFALKANAEISERLGVCTYIIETNAVKKYVGEENDIYECMFMAVKNSGFAYGFSIVASFKVENDKVSLIAIRSQPMNVEAPGNVGPFVGDSSASEFVNFRLVKEVASPNKSELDSVKNNFN
jgi:hypothetical protein